MKLGQVNQPGNQKNEKIGLKEQSHKPYVVDTLACYLSEVLAVTAGSVQLNKIKTMVEGLSQAPI